MPNDDDDAEAVARVRDWQAGNAWGGTDRPPPSPSPSPPRSPRTLEQEDVRARRLARVASASWVTDVSDIEGDSEDDVDDGGEEGGSVAMRRTEPPFGAALSRGRRLVAIGVAALVTLLTSGMVFGWQPLLQMLQSQHVYEWLCDANATNATNASTMLLLPTNGTTTSNSTDSSLSKCDAQASALALVFTVASSVFALGVLPAGIFLDMAGPRWSAVVGGIVFSGGLVLFAFSSESFPAYAAAYALVALGGPPQVFSFMHLSNLVTWKATVLTLYNVLIDVSSINFVFFNLIYDATGQTIPYKNMFLLYAAVPLAASLVGFFLWPNRSYENGAATATTPTDTLAHQPTESSLLLAKRPMAAMNIGPTSTFEGMSDDDEDGRGWEAQRIQSMRSYRSWKSHRSHKSHRSTRSGRSRRSLRTMEHTVTWRNAMEDVFVDLTFVQQLKTPAFWFIGIYTCFGLLHVNTYIAAVQYEMAKAYSADNASLLSTVFGWVLPGGGLLSVPLVGVVLDTYGLLSGSLFLTLTHVAFGVLTLGTSLGWYAAIPLLEIITYVFCALYRALLFAVMTTFVALMFGFRTFGRLWGTIFFFSGIVNFVVDPIVNYANSQETGMGFLVVNVSFTGLAVISFLFNIWTFVETRSILVQDKAKRTVI